MPLPELKLYTYQRPSDYLGLTILGYKHNNFFVGAVVVPKLGYKLLHYEINWGGDGDWYECHSVCTDRNCNSCIPSEALNDARLLVTQKYNH